jgi:hypothetical protein
MGISLKGAAGQAGSQIFFITGSPTDSNASSRPGDVAFATDTNLIYQRGPSAWPANGTLLRGGMGMAGTNSQLYVQSGEPSNDLGKGDDGIYVRSDTGELYSRDSADATWTKSTYSLRGPAGADGAKGADGIRGSQIYTGSGAPSSNLASYSPPAMQGDLYLSVGGAHDPTLYVLGS